MRARGDAALGHEHPRVLRNSRRHPTPHALSVTLRSDTNTLDYFARHVQIEAVFNRGLKLERSRPDDEEIVFTVTGDPKRVRGFLKWCYAGRRSHARPR